MNEESLMVFFTGFQDFFSALGSNSEIKSCASAHTFITVLPGLAVYQLVFVGAFQTLTTIWYLGNCFVLCPARRILLVKSSTAETSFSSYPESNFP